MATRILAENLSQRFLEEQGSLQKKRRRKKPKI
jgi:hypothetical protein